MSNLRQFVDGVGSIDLGLPSPVSNSKFSLKQDVVIRRKVSRGGPLTSQVIVGQILAMNGNKASVSVRKQNTLQTIEVLLSDLSPVTTSFKLNSIQFEPAFRGRV